MSRITLTEQHAHGEPLTPRDAKPGAIASGLEANPSESGGACWRRSFLGRAGGVAATALAGGALAQPGNAPAMHDLQPGVLNTTPARRLRVARAFQLRVERARLASQLPLPGQPVNFDEEAYPARIGNFSKSLSHNPLGDVNPDDYRTLLRAIGSGRHEDFDQVPVPGDVKLCNPQGAFASVLEGADSTQFSIRAAPAFNSAEEASEMAEVYWQALTRDVPFEEYATNDLTWQAAADMSAFSDFRGPKSGGVVIPDTLFRGVWQGDLDGPYVSQFLLKPLSMGATVMPQLIKACLPGVDYMTNYADWLAVQNGQGFGPALDNTFDPIPRYIRNNRDLGEWVHRDFPYLAPMNAALILLGMSAAGGVSQDILDAGHPYGRQTRRGGKMGGTSPSQWGFATFGVPFLLDLAARVGDAALRAAWYQKWIVHRRLRPEEFGGRVHNHLTGAASHPVHPELLASAALGLTFDRHGSYLLPQAYLEGCPSHPAYPSGHATFVGAGVTVLKAFFDESFVIPDPVMASADGLSLVPYSGAPLTIGGELNKLASNVAIGRNAAGVHWRTDAVEGNRLGEAVAIAILRDVRACMNERFNGFSLTRFDGTTIAV